MMADSELHVYVRAGGDGSRVAACPLGHSVVMCAKLLVERRAIGRLHVHTLPASRPPPAQSHFARHSLGRVPALVAVATDDDATTLLAVDGADEVLRVLGDQMESATAVDSGSGGGGGSQEPHSRHEDQLVGLNWFSRFCNYMRCLLEGRTCASAASSIRCLDHARQRLVTELQHLDRLLTAAAHPFLSGRPAPGRFDCELMPKLHHVRVACQRIAAADDKSASLSLLLPTRFTGLWRYLHTAYSLPSFAGTCPCDQEIELHWRDRVGFEPLTYERHKLLCCQPARFSFHVLARAVPCRVISLHERRKQNGDRYTGLDTKTTQWEAN